MINNIGNLTQGNINSLNTLNTEQTQSANGVLKTSPYATYNSNNSIDESQISKDAIKLYEHEKDIKNFTKIALEGLEDDTQTESLMQGLFSKGVIDIDNDDIWSNLATNQNLLDDLMG